MTLTPETLLALILFAGGILVGLVFGTLMAWSFIFFAYRFAVAFMALVKTWSPAQLPPQPDKPPIPPQPAPPVPDKPPAPTKPPIEPKPAPAPAPEPPAPVVKTYTDTGAVSWFGGPHDTGVSASEGLALVEKNEVGKFPGYFLAEQPSGTDGLARRLDPASFFIAMRWDYHVTPRPYLQTILVEVTAKKTGKTCRCRPVDWGPNVNTHRVADISKGAMDYLGIETDDVVICVVPLPALALPKPADQHLPPTAEHPTVMSDATLIKAFGDFTYREDPRQHGAIIIDPSWQTKNIVTITVPQLTRWAKTIQCNKVMAQPFLDAWAEIEAAGLLDRVRAYDGLWVTRHKDWDPSRGISRHTWGLAADINADWNPYGSTPAPKGATGSVIELVPIFEKHGFAWGGYFSGTSRDGMHFEYSRTS